MEKGQLSRKSVYTADPEDLVIIGLDTKHKKGEHPLWDERAKAPVDEAMVCNMMVYGVLETVSACREGDDVVLVNGRTRTKAAREANRRLRAQGSATIRVPILFKAGDDARLFGVMVSANEHRKADDILVKASKAVRMLDFCGDVTEVANAFGVTKQTLHDWGALLSVAPEVKKAIRAGDISSSAAVVLAKLPREAQVASLDEMVASGNTTIASAKNAVTKAKNPKAVANPAPKKAVIKKIYALRTGTLHPQALAMLGWILGKVEAKDVKGLDVVLTGPDFK